MHALIESPALSDELLIARHLAGDGTAFRRIVERYQGAVCAVAYSACGDLAASEDVAQEAFVAAWRDLPRLRDRAKLRPWLCGIARHLAHNALRRAPRTPTARAVELPADLPAGTADPRERTGAADAAALMWDALAGLPETYREPMVLFYREQQSIAAVAAALELTEETARQRLARGRTMLTDRMARLVEETLGRSGPAPAFVAGVLLALPKLTGPLVAGTVLGTGGATAAQTTVAAAGGVVVKLLASVAALPTLLHGVTDYLRFRAEFQSAGAAGREAVAARHLLEVYLNAAVLGGLAFLIWAPVPDYSKPLAVLPFAVGVAPAAILERRQAEDPARSRGAVAAPPRFEYQSRGGWLGLPWVHVCAGGPWRRRRAAGWIAVSDGIAIGGVFAGAPYAIAPVSVGGVAVGLLALGGVAVAWGALGFMAAGGWAAGAAAAGIHAALGPLAVAGEFAAGGVALAAHANDASAMAVMQHLLIFRVAAAAWQVAVWAAFLGWLPPLLLIGAHLARSRRPPSSR